MVADHSIVHALQVEQYSNRPGARVVGFDGGGGTKQNFRGTLTQPRPDNFRMPQQSGEYFAPNPILSSFGMDFALKFGGEDQKNKKGSSSQNLTLHDHVHSISDLSCCFIEKNRLW